jgi:PAS domain S-box-containing protein
MQALFRRINDWPFGTKLIVALLIVVALPTIIGGIVIVQSASQSLQQQAYNELDAIGAIKANALKNYMFARIGDSQAMAERQQFSGDPTGALGVGAMSRYKADRSSPEFTTAYTAALDGIHSLDKAYPGTYNDIMLIDNRGDMMAQLDQTEAAAEANVATQPFFLEGKKGLYLSGIVKYTVSGEDTYIIARPLLDTSGRQVGVLGIQVNLTSIDTVLNDRTGLGETGETYLVGTDKLMLSQSRFSDTPTRLVQKVDTYAVQQALAGQTGVSAYPDYRGVPTLGHYQAIPEYGWVMISEVDQAEAFAPVNQMIVTASATVGIALLGAAVVAFILARLLTQQVGEFGKVFAGIRIGDFEARARVFSGDELGKAADGINAMLDYVTNLLSGSVARMESIVQGAADGIISVDGNHNITLFNTAAERIFDIQSATVMGQPLARFLPSLFQGVTGDAFKRLAQSGESSRMLGGSLELTALRADGEEFPIEASISRVHVGGEEILTITLRDVTQRHQLAQEVEHTAEQVADASNSMGEVVRLLSTQASDSVQVAERAASSAHIGDQAVRDTIGAMERIRNNTQETSRRIKRLGEMSQEIGEAVSLIEEISDRTTVLALNASIQAAAAGDAGRGFAVVAEEVQRLAERATGATRQIEDLVRSIRAETNEAVVGMEDATREVVDGSALAHQAGDRMAELNGLIGELANVVQSAAQMTMTQTSQSVTQLSQLTSGLQTAVAGLGAGTRTVSESGNGHNPSR